MKSISRRLGYLHTSPAAQSIVKRWLADEGLLGRVEELNETGSAMLNNVAPVHREGAIDAIERAILRTRQAGKALAGEEFRTLLLSLAFEAGLFDRCVALILDLIEFEEPGRFANQVRNSFPSLFHPLLSGTHATVEQRCRVVDGLLKSASEVRRELGFKSLEAMLQTSGFSSFHHFEFGGRSRDYGWYPKGRQDVEHWFHSVLALCVTHDVRTMRIPAVSAQFWGRTCGAFGRKPNCRMRWRQFAADSRRGDSGQKVGQASVQFGVGAMNRCLLRKTLDLPGSRRPSRHKLS